MLVRAIQCLPDDTNKVKRKENAAPRNFEYQSEHADDKTQCELQKLSNQLCSQGDEIRQGINELYRERNEKQQPPAVRQ